VVTACLVDVYDTILTSDFVPRLRALSALAGVDPASWAQEWFKTGTERGQGKLSMADSFALTLRACGIAPSPALVESLVSADAELLRDDSRLYDDSAEFLGKLRSRGIGVALVSNCSPSTRQMLEHLGVIALADAAILSCEVGSLKPSPEIYLDALAALGVAPADAVMIDDQARFCAGAQAVGVRAIQIVRDGPAEGDPDGDPPGSAFPVVRTLLDALRLL
jgi:putative hydrolase of the HAD superfamily